LRKGTERTRIDILSYSHIDSIAQVTERPIRSREVTFKRPKRVSLKELMRPIKATCFHCKATCFHCKGTCYIIPIHNSKGLCLCSKCTFNSIKNLSLPKMLSLLYSNPIRKKKQLKRKKLKQSPIS